MSELTPDSLMPDQRTAAEQHAAQLALQEARVTRFAERFPRSGEVREGGRLTVSQAIDFTENFLDKLMDLHRKEPLPLTPEEQAFIEKTVDLGTRNVVHWLGEYELWLPISPETTRVTNILRTNVSVVLDAKRDIEGDTVIPTEPATETLLSDKDAMIRFLSQVTGGGVTSRGLVELSVPLQNYARSITAFTREMAVVNSGLPIDRYLEGNLKNLISYFELTEE